MKAIALIEAPQHVCYRYRIEAHLPELVRRGSTLSAVAVSPRLPARLRQLRQASTADVVILQRKLLPAWQLLLLRRWARTLIYDFDDAVFHRDSFAAKGIHSASRMMHFWGTIYAADAVIAGNEFLATQAARFVGSERVTMIPTCVRPATYPVARHDNDNRATRLVWIGQPSTLQGLRQIQPHMTAAARSVASLELRVVCSEFPQFAGIRVVARPWSHQSETEELADCDIGIGWLPDDPWSAGKCGLKVLQYMAAGLPVVANPVGMHCQLVQHGETGFLATTPQEWAAAIARLASDPLLRRQMGAAGRRLVEDRYNADRWSCDFASVLEGAARDTKRVNRRLSPNVARVVTTAEPCAELQPLAAGGRGW